MLGAVAAVLALAADSAPTWTFPSPLPFLRFTLRLDPLSSYFILALALVGIAVSIYSLGSVRRPPGLLGFFYNLSFLAMALVFSAGDLFLFLMGWELMALSAWALVSYHHEEERTRDAGILFFILSHAGTGCLVIAFLLLFRSAGSFDFGSFRAAALHLSPATRNAAFLLFFAGFGVKAGIVPLHVWLPAAHPVAPSNVSAIMSGIMIKTGIYGLTRVLL